MNGHRSSPYPRAMDPMFHFDRGLKLSKAGLAIDCRRRQPRAFISHAHQDHMARHQYALCTPATARFYRFRLGHREVLELPFQQPVEWGGLRLTTFPAGHCLGSAMLLAEDGDESLLYTGDFKLQPSLTAELAVLPRADILVMESTYGEPAHRRAPRAEAVEQLVAIVRSCLERYLPPVVQAYSLGKAQEVTRILTDAGIGVLQAKGIFELSQVYESLGVPLGRYERYTHRWKPGYAVIVPPRIHRQTPLPGLKRSYQIAVTGWAGDNAVLQNWGADIAIPLSDHADYDELFEAVRRVSPRIIYCTHGPLSFVERLREAGFDAHRLGEPCIHVDRL